MSAKKPPATQVAVVAGACSGIGLAVCRQFAEQGHQVVAGALDPDAQALRHAAQSARGNLHVAALDVADDGSVANAFADIFDRFGGVDVLVNCAGVGCIGAVEETSLTELRHSMEVNFFGVVRTTKAVLPRMREAGRGRLIAVSSLGGLLGQPFQDAYCASKFALEGFYESLRPLAAQYDALMAAGESRAQAAEEVAACIVSVAGEAEPRLRFQTSRFATKLAALKMQDLDGDAVDAFTANWFK